MPLAAAAAIALRGCGSSENTATSTADTKAIARFTPKAGSVERVGGLVEVHDLHDAQVVVGRHDAGQHAQEAGQNSLASMAAMKT